MRRVAVSVFLMVLISITVFEVHAGGRSDRVPAAEDPNEMLIRALSDADVTQLRLALERGANPNLRRGGDMVQGLGQRYRTPREAIDFWSIRDGLGVSFLGHAIAALNDDFMVLLLAAGADPNGFFDVHWGDSSNRKTHSPLTYAISNGYIETVGTLLEAGADPDLSVQRMWPIHVAVSSRNTAAIPLLVSANANVNAHADPGVARSWVERMLRDTPPRTDHVRTLFEAGLAVDNVDSLLDRFLSEQNEAVLSLLIEAGADPNRALFQLIATRNASVNTRIIRSLIDSGADLTSTNAEGDTTLIAFARNRDLSVRETSQGSELVRMMLDQGVDPFATDRTGRTAREIAEQHSNQSWLAGVLADVDRRLAELIVTMVRHESAEAIRAQRFVTIEQIVAFRSNNDRNTALMYAAASNPDPEVICVLVSAGADPHAVNEQNMTALMFAAAQNPSVEVLEVLLEQNPALTLPPRRMGAEGTSAAVLAVRGNPNPESLRTLLAAGASIAERATGGNTLLMEAVQHNPNPRMAALLVELGANVNTRNLGGDTALTLAAATTLNAEIIEVLLRAGADVHWADESGDDALIAAAAREKASMAVLLTLFGAGADLDRRNSGGRNAFLSAIRAGHTPDIIRLFLDRGADPNDREVFDYGFVVADGYSALSLSAMYSSVEVVQLLLEAGANPNPRRGDSPLVFAARRNSPFTPQILKLLLEAGSDVHAITAEGFGGDRTVMEAARRNPSLRNTDIFFELNDLSSRR